MAGIGFALRELDRRETIFGAATSAGHGMVVAAGPWIFTVVSLALIHRGTSKILITDASFNFRSVIMYAFAISLLATAPVINIAVRLASDDLYSRYFGSIRSRYIVSAFLCCAMTLMIASAVFSLIFEMKRGDFAIAVFSSIIISLIWPTLAFCGAVRDYKGITAGFAVGMLISILGAVWAARAGFGTFGMTMMFLIGLAVVFFSLASRILLAFPGQTNDVGKELWDFYSGIRQHWMLALGSFLAIAAIWCDKWIMWFGPEQVLLANGLLSAPSYDGAMFLAYLVMIPALGLFVTAIETTVFEDSRRLLDSIRAKAPLGRIERFATQFETQTYATIYRVLMTLATFCVIVMLLSPIIAPWIGLQYQQLGVFRLGVLAVFFQFIFVIATSVVLFLDRQARFLLLQALFLFLQCAFTMMSIRWGKEFYGYGHLLACALGASVAFYVLDRTLSRVLYLTFAQALLHPVKRPAAAPAVNAVLNPLESELDEEGQIAELLPVMRAGPLLRP